MEAHTSTKSTIGTKYQIAVVDDEPRITKLLKILLEEAFDCEVEVFNNSMEAYERIQEKYFNLISLDHRMLKLTGMDLVKLVRTSNGPNKKSKMLLLTAFRDEAECSHLDLLDDVIILEKPIENERYIRWANVMLKSKK